MTPALPLSACLMLAVLAPAAPGEAVEPPAPSLKPCCRAQRVVVPGLAQGDGALTASERTRLVASIRTLWAARREDASLVDVGFPEARWQEVRVAVAEHGRRVCRTAHRLPVVLQLRTPAGERQQREASLWRAEGQDRLSLEVEPPRQPR